MSFKFSSASVETMAKYLCSVVYLSNQEGYLCGHGIDQVYGCAYAALKNLLYKEIGAKATEYAMNSRTWCCSDFAGQILPAIDEGIEEAKLDERHDLANKMIQFLEKNCSCAGWTFYHSRNDNYFTATIDEDVTHQIGIDWNDVHSWLGY